MHTNESILSALRTFIEQRPGFDWRNYQGAPEAYRADCTTALRGLHDARVLLRACALASVSADDLRAALTDAHRLTLNSETGALEFTACQYPPTEYRAAACRALADALERHYMPSVPDRAALLRLLRDVLGARLVQRWF